MTHQATPQRITDNMPPVPEGYQRYYTRWNEGRWTMITTAQSHADTHYFDLANLDQQQDRLLLIESALREPEEFTPRNGHDEPAVVWQARAVAKALEGMGEE